MMDNVWILLFTLLLSSAAKNAFARCVFRCMFSSLPSTRLNFPKIMDQIGNRKAKSTIKLSQRNRTYRLLFGNSYCPKLLSIWVFHLSLAWLDARVNTGLLLPLLSRTAPTEVAFTMELILTDPDRFFSAGTFTLDPLLLANFVPGRYAYMLVSFLFWQLAHCPLNISCTASLSASMVFHVPRVSSSLHETIETHFLQC